MREMLFRGKRVSDGKWAFGSLVTGLFFDEQGNSLCYILDPDISEYDCFQDFEEIDCEVIPETVGQFTGNYCKNGKKVFEGDIVRHKGEDFVQEIKWHYGNFKMADDFYGDLVSNCFVTEVVGNVHDIPDWLEMMKRGEL